MSRADKIIDLGGTHTFQLADMYDLAKDLEEEVVLLGNELEALKDKGRVYKHLLACGPG